MRTLAIVNQKGGCGKTTTAINLSAVFARRGLRTLLVDMDPQSHCATGLGVPEQRIDMSVADALIQADSEKFDPADSVWEVGGNLDLMPSTVRLAGLGAPGGGLHELPDRDRRLGLLLARLAERYDRCLIDCPPTIGLLTFNALRAAREALIPVETGFFALRGADRQWKTIRQLIERIGRPIACHLVPTLYNPESALATDILAALKRQFAGQVIPVVVREDEVVREAASFGQPVIEYAPESDARDDFDTLAAWLEEHPPNPGVQIEVVPGAGQDAAGPIVTTPPPLQMPSSPHGRAAELAERVRGFQSGSGTDPDDLPPLAETILRPDAEDASTPDTLGAPAPAPPLESPESPHAHRDDPGTAGAPDPQRGEKPQSSDAGIQPEGGPTEYGATPTGRGVFFRHPGDGTCRVYVAGDFNQWSASATPLPYDNRAGAHGTYLQIPPGRYRYRLIVDGCWKADPFNQHRQVNEYGEMNSVLVVPDPRAKPAPSEPAEPSPSPDAPSPNVSPEPADEAGAPAS